MKSLLFLITFLICTIAIAQSNTDVYLLNIHEKGGKLELTNLKNISNNLGYDNQPSFYNDKTILFSATRNQQTDIALYNIQKGTTTWISNTAEGSEYSPLKIPFKKAVSAIRLDTDGVQRLYKYRLKNGKSTVLLKYVKVGYHVWYNKNILVSTVLVENRMDLIVFDLKNDTNYTVEKNVGRSLHKIPNTERISYISKDGESWTVKSLQPISKNIEEIETIDQGIDDICWLQDGSMLIAKNKSIFRFDPSTKEWGQLWSFREKEINEITRMAVSPNGRHLAIVSKESPELIVRKQVETFNARDLDAFVACYSDDVVVRNFPNDTLYMGNAAMKKSYEHFYANTPEVKVAVNKRIVIGNKVIDEEIATVSGKTHQQVAIYEIVNDLISSMTFIHSNSTTQDPEAIVQKQLDSYNTRNLDAFIDTYTDTVKLFDYPNTLSTKGKNRLRELYSGFFEATKDLNCEIKNRIVIGNKVIDEEYLTVNGNNFSAVGIYEVENGKIAKVTFVR